MSKIKKIVKDELAGLLREIEAPGIKKEVSRFFLKDVSKYADEMSALIALASEEEGYSVELEEDIEHLNNFILLKGFCLEELVSDDKIMAKVKECFRRLCGSWLYKSEIIKRAFEKPRGYAGDYQTLGMIYDNKPTSKHIGVYFDNNFLKSPYAVAMRLRKERMKELLHDFIQKTTLSSINIMSIACGSCRELRDLFSGLKPRCRVEFTCIDEDEEALSFSKNAFASSASRDIEFKFVKDNMLRIIKDKDYSAALGKQNLIYSLGLIDSLSDAELKELIPALYRLLFGGGRLILAHKDRDKTFPTIYPDWFCDWRFVRRNKEEMVKLFYACGLSRFTFSLVPDDFGYIYYYILTKL